MPQPNYNIDPHEHPHYFDLVSGTLFVNDTLLVSALDSGQVSPQAVLELGELLLSDFEIDAERYEQIDASEWPLRLYRKFGKWLDHAVTEPDEARTNITRDVIDRSYYFGFGPPRKNIVHPTRFSNLTRFYQEIDVLGYRQPGWYDNWSHDWFADYVQEVFETKKPDETLTEALARRSEVGEGPSWDIILSHAGRPMALLEERGYADVRSWDQDTHVDWNVAFRMANNRIPGKKDFAYLGSINRRRGPSLRAVIGHFTKLSSYQAAADERYPQTMRTLAERVHNRSIVLQAQKKGQLLVQSIITTTQQPLWVRSRVSAQYLLLDALRPDAPKDFKERAATLVRQQDFIDILERFVGRFEVSQMREFAYALDPTIEADIWPRHNPEHLYVPR